MKLLQSLQVTTPDKIASALLSVVIYDSDFEWVQSLCFQYVHSPHENVKWIAIICLGHIARIHRKIDKHTAITLLETLLTDEMYGGQASDALDDITRYTLD